MKPSASKTYKSKKSTRGHQRLRPLWVLIFATAILLIAAGAYFIAGPIRQGSDSKTPDEVRRPDGFLAFEELIGRWQRPDGGYIIEIRDIDESGRADARYFNPRPIHVAQAVVLKRGTMAELFVELQDEGYPGATYQLVYNPQQKMLSGIYHQPAAGGSFEVFFVKAP